MAKSHYGKQTGPAVMREIPAPAGGVQLETFIPWTLVKCGVRKEIITPIDAPQAFQVEATRERQARDAAKVSPLMRALGLAHHWLRLLDEQRVASVADLAKAEGLDATQVRRMLRLTLLAPEIVERLVHAPGEITVDEVTRRPWPNDWKAQARLFEPPK